LTIRTAPSAAHWPPAPPRSPRRTTPETSSKVCATLTTPAANRERPLCTIQENIGGSGGGGIYNSGTAIIHQSTIVSNSAPNAGLGGGIYNSGILTLTNSIVKGNSVLANGWGSNAGGVYNSGVVMPKSQLKTAPSVKIPLSGGTGGFGNLLGCGKIDQCDY
jgi:hypothetical protein